jgi:hypothetical protein
LISFSVRFLLAERLSPPVLFDVRRGGTDWSGDPVLSPQNKEGRMLPTLLVSFFYG